MDENGIPLNAQKVIPDEIHTICLFSRMLCHPQFGLMVQYSIALIYPNLHANKKHMGL